MSWTLYMKIYSLTISNRVQVKLPPYKHLSCIVLLKTLNFVWERLNILLF